MFSRRWWFNIPTRTLLQKWFNIICKMIVLMTYAQICPKWFLAVMTPRYIAFILTENWFGQNWAGMRNWHYVGHWVNVRNFRRKKSFFQNFNTFFCFENDLSVIFGFLTPKFIKVPLFMKIEWTKLKIWTKMHYQKFPRWPPKGWKREIVIQTFDRNTSKTIWDRTLKFGTFTYLMTCTYAPNFIEIWKGGFQTCPTLMWNFPKAI